MPEHAAEMGKEDFSGRTANNQSAILPQCGIWRKETIHAERGADHDFFAAGRASFLETAPYAEDEIFQTEVWGSSAWDLL